MNRPMGHATGIAFYHPAGFWLGLAAITGGVLLHLQMFVMGRDVGYAMSRMSDMLGSTMLVGMVLIGVGLAGTVWGLVPTGAQARRGSAVNVEVRALDDAKIGRKHVAMLIAMAFAVTIDVMKPITLGFVAPGMTKEYGLKSALNPTGHTPVSILPLVAIIGTVMGSFIWGYLGDRIGRRASILLAAVLFVATAICGAMPTFVWNIVMCFLMGIAVGGMLPIAFTLMAETIPARHRGWLMVLIGGDVAGAFIATSALAAWLIPMYSWRVMWLIGLPTGLVLILLNRWIPESPRFLLANGREDEARAVMAHFGATVVASEPTEPAAEPRALSDRFAQLFRAPFFGLSMVVTLFGLGVGLVTFGFQLWIPTNLQALGFSEVSSDKILRDSALLGFPATFLIAFLYGFWSSRKTLIVLGWLTAASLLGFVVTGDAVVPNRPLLYGLLVVPITGISSILAVLMAYASEVYPTRIRSRGAGLAGGAAKVGGVLIIAMVFARIAAPSIAVTAFIGAVPMALAAIAVTRWGVETKTRALEDIAADVRDKESVRSARPA